MQRATAEFSALGETTVFLDYFKDLPDPRQRGKIIYPLAEVLLLCLLAVAKQRKAHNRSETNEAGRNGPTRLR